MINAYKQPSRRQAGTFLTFVRPEYRKGYQIPGMEIQESGIQSMTLWTTRQTILRIIPGYDSETGEIFPQNININEYSTDDNFTNYLSDTFVMASIIDGFGSRGSCFITSYAPGSPEDVQYGGDTVINAFARAVNTAVLNHSQGKKTRYGVTPEMQQWAAMNGPLRYPKQALLMQALVFKKNGNDITDANGEQLIAEDGTPFPQLDVVAVVGKATLNALLQALVEPLNPGMPLKPSENNKYGAMAELNGNLLYMNPVQDPTSGHNMLRPSVQEPGKGWTPTPYELTVEDVHNLWVPWEKLLHYQTPEEQCRLLASEFGADSVNYFIGTDPLFHNLQIPEDIKKAGYGRYAQFVGGNKQAASKPSVARTQFGMPKAATQALKQAHTNYTPKSVSEAKTAEPGPGLTNLRANSTIDTDKLRSTLSSIRKASAGGQAATAQSILDDTDLDAYQEPGIDEVE